MKSNVIYTDAQGEYLVKLREEGEPEIILLTGDELIDVLESGEIEAGGLSWISLEIPTGFITYDFLEKEWRVEE